ncbi:MAG: DUF4214 domain-containing protein [Actinomycetota bacterium]|nr:DUF4214 domain-containing protein [Actinomycetota bacterium]
MEDNRKKMNMGEPTLEQINAVGSPRRMFRVGLIVLGLLSSLLTGMASTAVAAAEIRPITFPVHPDFRSQVYWTDTFGAARSGGRTHIGVDVMGPKMTPLVAAVDGTVTWVRHDRDRGNNLELTDAQGWQYHYVHINNDTPGTDDGANAYELAFAPGIQTGSQVRAGQVIAFLGDSGNAESAGSHLHFEITRPDGTSLNPTPSVDDAAARLAQMPPLTAAQVRPHPSLNDLVLDVFTTLTGEPAASAEAVAFARAVAEQGLSAALVPYVDQASYAASIDRLYVAFFLRAPDFSGYQYWIARHDLDLRRIADHFAASPEYQARYGNLDFGLFLDQLYRDVLGRAPDEAGKAYWLARLADPRDEVTKGTIVAFFTDSIELRQIAALRSEIVALTALFHDRMPTEAEIHEWAVLRANTPLAQALQSRFLAS